MNSRLRAMADSIVHRGPDCGGAWIDGENGIALGHRRLSIIDVSSSGAQPMSSPSGRYVIVFNGEIYNHNDIRSELNRLGAVSGWRGHSDTETLVAGFDAWGVEATVKKAVGMFAIAVWDSESRILHLMRDRLGEKPLYYGWQGTGGNRVFLFGSELKAISSHPAFNGSIDRDAVSAFFRYGHVPGELSIFHDIRKLAPGKILSVSQAVPDPCLSSYWDALSIACGGKNVPFLGTPKDAVNSLEHILTEAIRLQMVADVPLGAFLSGGVDSSTVVALMQSLSSRPVKTFTIGFDEEGYNEATYARDVAKYLNTDHTELYVSPVQAMNTIPRMPFIYDEPFADSSQIPTFLVSQLAGQHVKVSLSGDGGDELFSGYNRYHITEKYWHKLNVMPTAAKAVAASLIRKIPPEVWNRLSQVIGADRRWANLGDKLHKGAGVLNASSLSEVYLRMASIWQAPSQLVLNGDDFSGVTDLPFNNGLDLSNVERMMLQDMLTYLPGDILAKVDRAAMGVSLETRVPMLDHRVVEFAWTLPQEYKMRQVGSSITTKWILREILYRHVPRHLIERPKMGFGVPVGNWLRGPLRDWAESLLDTSVIRNQGFLDPNAVRSKWLEHLSGKANRQNELWCVLMFQSWLQRWGHA